MGGRSTALTIAGHDAQRRRVSAGVGLSRGQLIARRFMPSRLPRKHRRSSGAIGNPRSRSTGLRAMA